jgi:hypothetical protein
MDRKDAKNKKLNSIASSCLDGHTYSNIFAVWVFYLFGLNFCLSMAHGSSVALMNPLQTFPANGVSSAHILAGFLFLPTS